ncbi:hypothetical protein TcasGA2_TC003660 [Tribolium castaneum]|uniref:Uncharacterized protein n=1 Tax=Tribolium castaneum TaxID=7070 RepID=D6WDH1_TRICA|nr:hypothetical protein TcasGA2_TC003660 [Tribolium castaneum]
MRTMMRAHCALSFNRKQPSARKPPQRTGDRIVVPGKAFGTKSGHFRAQVKSIGKCMNNSSGVCELDSSWCVLVIDSACEGTPIACRFLHGNNTDMCDHRGLHLITPRGRQPQTDTTRRYIAWGREYRHTQSRRWLLREKLREIGSNQHKSFTAI